MNAAGTDPALHDAAAERAAWNGARFRADENAGHYESWFQRANHPTRPLAFWIRYTIFRPADPSAKALGELWAIWFDGERGLVKAAKEVVPLAACRFATRGIDVRIGGSHLDDAKLEGSAANQRHSLAWSLRYATTEPPLLLLPRDLYERPLPRAKALVGSPNADFSGRLTVDGERIDVDGWRGSQNHNWGSRHTDSYAWGQVAGFDDAPDVFLECSTAQIRLGPVWTPRMSLLVLRADGEETAINSLGQSIRARGRCEGFDWRIESRMRGTTVRLRMHAPPSAFVGLTYFNPPGGSKTCLNTKLAACELTLERDGHAPKTWSTRHRAAFEILTDRTDHGIAVVA
jgi:hypothetical protein